MSRSTFPTDLRGAEPPLTGLREPDVSGLALWAAVFVASSALLAFFATAPAHAWPNAQRATASAQHAAASAAPLAPAGQAASTRTRQPETGSLTWQ